MATILSAGGLASVRTSERALFSAEQCDALFAAVLVNDRIDDDVRLPARIHLDYQQDQLLRCFLICRQIWREGVDRSDFNDLIVTLRKNRSLSSDEQIRFKNIRAKFKQLRFAFVNFDKRHRYPRIFHYTTVSMGRLQDDFKNQRCGAVRRRAILLRLLLSRPVYALINREVERLQPTTVAAFRDHVVEQIAFIRCCLDKDRITAKTFHELRKIVSRQTSIYIGLAILYPSPYHSSILRYLSAVNGMMGSLHDDLIRKNMIGVQDYHHHAFTLPADINARLAALVSAFAI